MAITRETYTNNSIDNDEWHLLQKAKPTYAVPGVDNEDAYNLSYTLNKETSVLSTAFSNTYRYIDSDMFLCSMQESTLFIYGGHGSDKFLRMGGLLPSQSSYRINLDLIQTLSSTALEGTKLVLFVSCKSALGGILEENILSVTASKGAQAVVGFSSSPYADESLDWVGFFVGSLVDGYTIQDALARADALLLASAKYDVDTLSTTADQRVVVGNLITNPLTS